MEKTIQKIQKQIKDYNDKNPNDRLMIIIMKEDITVKDLIDYKF